jgi:hypothetical protein
MRALALGCTLDPPGLGRRVKRKARLVSGPVLEEQTPKQ